MPACMTEHEWVDLITLAMSIEQVEFIADFAGTPGPTKPGKFSLDWVCCQAWHEDKSARGWFSNAGRLLVDKNVVNS